MDFNYLLKLYRTNSVIPCVIINIHVLIILNAQHTGKLLMFRILCVGEIFEDIFYSYIIVLVLKSSIFVGTCKCTSTQSIKVICLIWCHVNCVLLFRCCMKFLTNTFWKKYSVHTALHKTKCETTWENSLEQSTLVAHLHW